MPSHNKLIHYYVHGRGLGHATRSVAVIRVLNDAGYRVLAFAGEDAELLVREATECRRVQSIPAQLGLNTPPLVAWRVAEGLAAQRAHRPSVVVSDSDLPGLLAARLAGIPAIVVGHGLITGTCHRPPGVNRGAWWREGIKVRASSLGATHHVPVSFVTLQPLDPTRTTVAAPALSPDLLDNAAPRPDGDSPLVAYFRDNNAHAVLDALSDHGQPVTLFTRHIHPTRAAINVRSLNRADFVEALRRAPAVVSSAGSQLMSECVFLGVSQFALYDADDDEQRLNVEMLRGAGLGDGCTFGSFTPERLLRFLAQLDPGHRTPPPLPTPDVSTAVLHLANRLG
jgi:UDP-N-acetylglucosamine--N-acetylmuramyl-(pentapeptide) pyrophosphoryl-undecaprenol N-acetylglucosamine transferase